MKKFACGDVIPGCTAKWLLADDDAIVAAVARHAAAEHGLTAVPADMEQAVRFNIRAAASVP
jgi:predicted small metal-binding protein